MIVKHATYPIIDRHGLRTVWPLDVGMIKAAGYELLPEVERFIQANLEPVPDKVRVLVNAMGAGEYWGSNLNGDYFPEAALCHRGDDYGYLTFYNAHPFKHHVNKDPAKSFGRVLFSAWNPLMKRIELIVEVDRELSMLNGAMDVYDRLAAGDYMSVSMGCKVRYDLCSICLDRKKYQEAKASFDPLRHRTVEDAVLEWHARDPIKGLARTRAEYCVHARTMMNRIFPDGRKVYVINDFPRFFDISFVYIGADKTARVLAKLASAQAGSKTASVHIQMDEPLRSDGIEKAASFSLSTKVDRERRIELIKQAEFDGKVKEADLRKISDILKEISTRYVTQVVPTLERTDKPIPAEVLDRLAGLGIPRAIGGVLKARILLSPPEFARLILMGEGQRELADRIWNSKLLPPFAEDARLPLPTPILSDIPPCLRPVMEHRSWSPEFLVRRVIIARRRPLAPAGMVGFGPPIEGMLGQILDRIARLYNDYRRLALDRLSAEGPVGIGPLMMLARMFGPTLTRQKRIIVILTTNPEKLADIHKLV